MASCSSRLFGSSRTETAPHGEPPQQVSAVSLLAERKLSVSVRALLLENVRNLLDMDDGETFREVIHSSIPRTSTGTQHDPLPVDR